MYTLVTQQQIEYPNCNLYHEVLVQVNRATCVLLRGYFKHVNAHNTSSSGYYSLS